MATLAPITHSLTATGARVTAFNANGSLVTQTSEYHSLALTSWRIEIQDRAHDDNWVWFVEDHWTTPDEAIAWTRKTFSYRTIEGVRLVSPDNICYGFNKLGECSFNEARCSFDFDHINTIWDSGADLIGGPDVQSTPLAPHSLEIAGLKAWDANSTRSFENQYQTQDVFKPSLAHSLLKTRFETATDLSPSQRLDLMNAIDSEEPREDFLVIHSLVSFLTRSFISFSLALHSLIMHLDSLSYHMLNWFSYRKIGGIHFIRIGRWSISVSRKRIESRSRDIEDSPLRILALALWPALAIVVVIGVEVLSTYWPAGR